MSTQAATRNSFIDDLLEGFDAPLVVTTRGAARFLVFNRPQACNALSRAMREHYAQVMEQADTDPAIRVVIVTGAHGYFSSGVDLKENPVGVRLPLFRPHPVEVTRAMGKPVIAMVDGPCVTGGLELTLACSFVIASDRSRFADTHIKIGIFPGWGLASLLSSAVGARRARQMSLTGEFIDARTACEWGIVNEITTVEGLLPRCLTLAAAMGACAERSVRTYVGLSNRIDGAAADTALATELVIVDRYRAGL
jgi:enoyl-CoA hydratase